MSRLTGYQVQPNKAIVGRNAFAHESGIHQDGVLKERTTYEIMDATTVGVEGVNSIVLGKHSGRHALRKALEELGFKVEGNALNTAFKRFKELADKKKSVTAMDLEALVSDEMREMPTAFGLEWFDIEAASGRAPFARSGSAPPSGELVEGEFTGDGPIDAFFSAINAATGHRGAATRVPRVGRHRRPRRARRGLGDHRLRGPHRRPARACRPTSSRPPAARTCVRSPTRSRTRRSPRPSTTCARPSGRRRPERVRFHLRRLGAADPLRDGRARRRREAARRARLRRLRAAHDRAGVGAGAAVRRAARTSSCTCRTRSSRRRRRRSATRSAGGRSSALGGGRVIDSAKALGGADDLPVAAVPTTLSGAPFSRIHRLPDGSRRAASSSGRRS